MRTGRSLQEIAAQLESQLETRKDYVAPQGALEARVVGEGPDGVKIYGLNGGDPVGINNHAHGQLADALEIPAKYYTRMREQQPELLAKNINTWLKDKRDEKRLVRVLDGRIRGILSPKYRPLDNYNLAQAVLPTLIDRNVKILSAELTETRFYIKGILPELSEPLPEGLVWGSGHTDIARVAPKMRLSPEQQALFAGDHRGRIVSAITISNSEVGAGTLRVEPSVFTSWCTNMAILIAAAMKKFHLGRAWEADSNFEVFTDATRQKSDEAFFMQVRDVTRSAFNEENFKAAIEQIREAGKREVTVTDLGNVVDTAVRQLALPVSTSEGILSFLSRGGDLTQWGLSSAITMAANEAESYELATQLEYAGGKVLALDDSQWKALAVAAN